MTSWGNSNMRGIILCFPELAKSFQSCPTLCNPIDGSPPGSPLPGILQARTLGWVAISFPELRDQLTVRSNNEVSSVQLLSHVRLFATSWKNPSSKSYRNRGRGDGSEHIRPMKTWQRRQSTFSISWFIHLNWINAQTELTSSKKQWDNLLSSGFSMMDSSCPGWNLQPLVNFCEWAVGQLILNSCDSSSISP